MEAKRMKAKRMKAMKAAGRMEKIPLLPLCHGGR